MEAKETRQIIKELKELISEEIYVHNRERVHDRAINEHLTDVTAAFLKSYDIQREHISALLDFYETSTNHVLNIFFPIFLKGLEELKELPVYELDLGFWDVDFDIEEVSRGYQPFFEANMKAGVAVRLSYNDPVVIETEKGGAFLRLIYKLLTHQSIKKIKAQDDITAAMLHLWMARRIARAIKRPELFYVMILVFFDSLYFNENYQFARDLAEECLICSYTDGIPEYGYYISFKVFASTASAATSLHYGIVSIAAFLKSGKINDYMLKNFYWEAIKFTRNLKLLHYAIDLFKTRPENITYTAYDLNKFHHAYFSSLFYLKEQELPSLILDYLDKNKEEIISGGEHEILPWLAMLLNVKKNYTVSEYDDRLDVYVGYLKPMVTSDNYNKIHNQLFGSLEEVLKDLKKSLLNLTFTRNQSDFITDNDLALRISHQNIKEAVKDENPEGYLLSMILQSDFSIVFKDKETKLVLPVHESYTVKDFDKEYYSPETLKHFVCNLVGCDILWLGTNDHMIFPMFYNNGQFHFIKDKARKLIEVLAFASDAISKLPHDTRTTGKSKREKFYEDYLEEEKQLLSELSFFSLPIQAQKTTLFIKDIEISAFPHNLISCEQGFISNIVPVANIMSLEWFYENCKGYLDRDFSKSIWIPVESFDMPVCMMHSKMEDDLKAHNIREERKLIPEHPLESDLNIIVAHGSDKISTFPAFYLRNETSLFTIKSFDHIIGKGMIAVLFVCHSGSEKSDLFRNQTSTVVKQFLQNGYQAVVAPFWALHIDIPPIWLPEFLRVLAKGSDIGTAVFKANRKVSSVFNTPKAYSCLHLYGNPFLGIKKDVEL